MVGYQLHTRGSSYLGSEFKSASKKIFLNVEDAEDHIKAFETECYDPKYFDYAEPSSLKTRVVEIDIVINGLTEFEKELT